MVSTHSHPKVAGQAEAQADWKKMFQHTATRRWLEFNKLDEIVHYVFQHTATRRWLAKTAKRSWQRLQFQHTATRRWLVTPRPELLRPPTVSTHSHPKVAGGQTTKTHAPAQFQHTATRRWLENVFRKWLGLPVVSTHSHPKVAGSYFPF